MRRVAFFIGLAGAFFTPTTSHAAFGLNVAIAVGDDGNDVQSVSWVQERVDLAERVLGVLDVHIKLARTRSLEQKRAHVLELKDRDALATLFVPGEINVFVVQSLQDSEVKGLYRMGVTWDTRTTPARRVIILEKSALRSSLAHELGHYFGIFAHSATKNNLMSYDREDEDHLTLDATQQATIKWTAQSYRTSGVLTN